MGVTTKLTSSNRFRVANRDALLVILKEIFALKTKKEWIPLLEEARVPCGPVNTMKEVFEGSSQNFKNSNFSRRTSIKSWNVNFS